jgi:hypothetical protein
VISEELKHIYNNHLVSSRKAKSEPFKIKKDFSNLDDDKIPYLEKLERFFHSYPNINQEDFFMAPHKVYPDADHYSLDFYTGQRAIKCYTQYMKMLDVQDPDSDDSLSRLQNSLKFIFGFCREKGLTLKDYGVYMEESIPVMVKHLKEHKINFYTIHALTLASPKIESRILDFMFSDFFGTFQKTKNKFFASKKMKEFSKQAKIKIENKLNG